MNKNELNILKCTPLSEKDIEKRLKGRTKVLKYNEMGAYKNINQLLHPYNNCVILLETEPEFGHWICLKKTENVRIHCAKRCHNCQLCKFGNDNPVTMISFFDSYGGFPDNQKHYIEEDFLQKSGQKNNKISQLLYDASFLPNTLIEFSHKKLQNIKNHNLATCGHWCCVFILSGMAVDDFNEYLGKYNEKDKDELVVKLYYNIIPKIKKQKLN